jgi:hypothetical protein
VRAGAVHVEAHDGGALQKRAGAHAHGAAWLRHRFAARGSDDDADGENEDGAQNNPHRYAFYVGATRIALAWNRYASAFVRVITVEDVRIERRNVRACRLVYRRYASSLVFGITD